MGTYVVINLRASFGTTKYCNNFICGIPCTNKECLYLHARAPPEDCFSRQHMTIGDKDFYLRTHPGKGSVWDPVQRIFVYKHRSFSRFAMSSNHLPPAHSEPQEERCCLHLHPKAQSISHSTTDIIYQFGFPKGQINHLSRQFKSRTFTDQTVFVFSSVFPTRKPKVRRYQEPIGQNVDLDELFGSVG